MRTRAARLLASATIALLLSACTAISGSDEQKGPVGIGKGINEMKRSPCACTEIPMSLPDNVDIG